MFRPYLKAAVFLLCLMQASCLPDSRPLQMPDTFLGEWIHEEGRFRYQINPDGTMTDTFIKTGKVCSQIEYKVLRVYSPERVAVLYRERNDCHEATNWSKPKLGVFFIEPPYEYTPYVGRTYRWDKGCYHATVEAWQHTEQYKADLLSHIQKDTRGCKNWMLEDLIWRKIIR